MDRFRECPALRRAEMIAHLWLRANRQAYEEHLAEQRAKKKSGKGHNPLEDMKRKWGIGSPNHE